MTARKPGKLLEWFWEIPQATQRLLKKEATTGTMPVVPCTLVPKDARAHLTQEFAKSWLGDLICSGGTVHGCLQPSGKRDPD